MAGRNVHTREFGKADADSALYGYLDGQNRSLNLVLKGAVRFAPFIADLYAKELEGLKTARDELENRAIGKLLRGDAEVSIPVPGNIVPLDFAETVIHRSAKQTAELIEYHTAIFSHLHESLQTEGGVVALSLTSSLLSALYRRERIMHHHARRDLSAATTGDGFVSIAWFMFQNNRLLGPLRDMLQASVELTPKGMMAFIMLQLDSYLDPG
jgi:hypothetical protein